MDDFNDYSDFKMRSLLNIFKLLSFIKEKNHRIYLTDSGSFWIHLVQNIFVLDYINNVWTIMKQEAFPKKIDI